jgi:hypothetical protein
LKLQFDLPAFHNEEQAEAMLSGDVSSGGITFNEYRRARNRPPHPDPRAETLPMSVFVKLIEQESAPPAPPPGQPGADGGGGDADPLAALAGGGSEAGDAPRPDNPAAKGSLPPRTKAFDVRAGVADWMARRGYAEAPL